MSEDYWPLSPFLYKYITISLIKLGQSHDQNSNCSIALTQAPERKKSKTSWRHTVERERKEESRDEVKTTAAN